MLIDGMHMLTFSLPPPLSLSSTTNVNDRQGNEFRARFGDRLAGWAFMTLFVAEVHPFTKRSLHLPRTYPHHRKQAGGGGGGGEAEVPDRTPTTAAVNVEVDITIGRSMKRTPAPRSGGGRSGPKRIRKASSENLPVRRSTRSTKA